MGPYSWCFYNRGDYGSFVVPRNGENNKKEKIQTKEFQVNEYDIPEIISPCISIVIASENPLIEDGTIPFSEVKFGEPK